MLDTPKPAASMPIIGSDDNPFYVPEISEESLSDIQLVRQGRVSGRTLSRFPFIRRLTLSVTAESFVGHAGIVESSYISNQLSINSGKRTSDCDSADQPAKKRPKTIKTHSPCESPAVSEEDYGSLRARYDELKEVAADLRRRCGALEQGVSHPGLHSNAVPASQEPMCLSPFIKELRTVCDMPYLEECDTFDEIALYLSEEGGISLAVLDMFRTTPVESISLTTSVTVQAIDFDQTVAGMMGTFALPGSFGQLRTLDLTCVPLKDCDVASISRLSMLECLHVGETDISSEAICHLVSLKSTLRILHIQDNPLIDDDAVPCLGYLSRLSFLAIYGTGITIHGIRKLALNLDRDGRDMSCNMPEACNTYIANLTSHYDVYPEPPLITAPDVATALTTSALKANLAAHHSFNKHIVLTGTKKELADRLSQLLERRKLDLLVRRVFRRDEISEVEISPGAVDYDDTLEDEDSLVPYGSPEEEEKSS